MQAFNTLTATAVPIDQANVDTDQIIPARFLGHPREQQVDAMFHDMRYDANQQRRADFVLNQPAYADAKIIVADRNFACGSSRENAVTVMVDNGFRAFIAPSFGDIFFTNCFQNGVLPIRLPVERVDSLRAALRAAPGSRITVDLANQQVVGPDGQVDAFEIDAFRKDCLLQGLDEISLTLSHEPDIARFEANLRQTMDWL
ncbi:MAG: 3-isopropylmalate dehydratase small subunit [Betaproteobacteria bacterium]|nr:3-isopropylmalate dehydratase small subunit [Betaproteobacteria bacterium]